jgi:hypothetical protein
MGGIENDSGDGYNIILAATDPMDKYIVCLEPIPGGFYGFL